MKEEGRLSKWNDDRGFGFITPASGQSDIFVHISAFPKGGYRPKIGERLIYATEEGKDGKKRRAPSQQVPVQTTQYPAEPVTVSEEAVKAGEEAAK